MIKKPEILLAYPSSFNCSIGIDDVDMKTSLLVLGSFLSPEYSIEYIDFEIAIGRPNSSIQIKRFERKVKEYFSQNSFDILGLSCWTSMSYRATLMVAKIFREYYPDKLIVVGGYHPTARPNEFVTEDNLFDYVVSGEGENAFRHIIESYSNSGRPEKTTIIKGESTNSGNVLPYNWKLLDPFMNKYFPDGLEKIYVYLSRGCPFDCSFCMESLKDRHWRALSPHEAFDQISTAVEKYNPRKVGIADACFGLRPQWRKEFLKLVAEQKPNYQLIFETRAEYMDEEDVNLLVGLDVEVQFGIESGSHQILRLMRKSRKPEKYLNRFKKVSELLSKHKILHRANIIFNHPGETENTLKETFSFIDTMLEIPESYLIWICRPYMHYPGCELDRNRSYYEQTFNSQFFKPEWWKENIDQYLASLDSVPSGDLSNDQIGRAHV